MCQRGKGRVWRQREQLGGPSQKSAGSPELSSPGPAAEFKALSTHWLSDPGLGPNPSLDFSELQHPHL